MGLVLLFSQQAVTGRTGIFDNNARISGISLSGLEEGNMVQRFSFKPSVEVNEKGKHNRPYWDR